MNENETIILTPVYDEDNAPYIYPEDKDLEYWQRSQIIVWGMEAMEREFWDYLESGRLERNPETMSYLTMIRGIKDRLWKNLAQDNNKIIYDEILEQASMII